MLLEHINRTDQIAFNRERWAAVLSSEELAKLPYRIETNVHGQLIMTPPPSGEHSYRQGEIAFQLRLRLGGHTLPECPVMTIEGVRAVDIGWYSADRFSSLQDKRVFEIAPEICVEVISPSNTLSELNEKKALYFEAGAEEVWFCQQDGRMEYYLAVNPNEPNNRSERAPDFPA